MRKLVIFIYAFVLISINNCLIAQVQKESIRQYNTVYSNPYLDSIAKFPGGEAGLIEYFRSNFNASQHVVEAAGKKSQYFIIDLKIDKEGNVDSVEFYETSLLDANKELRRLCENMPTWQPGYRNGEVVDSWVVLPFTYRIEDRFWEPEHEKLKVLVTKNNKKSMFIKTMLITLAGTILYLAWQ